MIAAVPRSQYPVEIRLRLFTVCLAVVVAFSSSAPAQSTDEVHVVPRADVKATSGAEKNAEAVSPSTGNERLKLKPRPLRVDVDLVLIPVVVTDTLNRPVMGLSKDSFKLLDDGQEQQIRFFSLEDGPLSIALVLDVSNSMVNRLTVEREALSKFFDNANPEDEYFAIGVSTHPVLLAESSQGVGDIQSRLALIQPAGYTALLDSIYLALDKLRSAHYQRKVILIISDGGENDSRFNYREIKELAEESDVLVYAIRPVDAMPMFRTIEEKLGNRLLSGITEATGGHTISLAESDNIPGAAATISTELRNQYVLGYHPATKHLDGKSHKIKVQMAKSVDSAPLHVRYRKQYSTAGR